MTNLVKLKYLAFIYNGNSIPDNEKSLYQHKEIPYLSSKDINIENCSANYDNGISVDRNEGFKIGKKDSTLLCIEGGSAGKKITYLNQDAAFVNKLCCFEPINIDSKYLFYSLQSKSFTDQFFLNISGLIGGVKLSILKTLTIPIVSRTIQNRISKTLDNKTSKIDALIANEQKQIERLKAYKQSLISELVTKGLDPNAPMKDSGIEWIGKIPEGWKIKPIANLYSSRNQKVTDLEFPPLSVTMQGILYQRENVAKSNDHDNRKLVKKGDFVINSRSDRRGACGISSFDGSVSLINTVLMPKTSMNYEYLDFLFHTKQFSDEYYRWGHGIVDDLWTTKWEDMRNIVVPIPPIDIQNKIVEELSNQSTRIDSLIDNEQKQIEKLKEYKQSLIFEYVTGKREIK